MNAAGRPPLQGGKPVDIGNGSLAASFGVTNGALLSLLAPHREHGVVELSAVPPFDERHRGDPAATRRHRARLTEDRYACLRLETAGGEPFRAVAIDCEDPLRPVWHGTFAARRLRVRASATADGDAIVLGWEATGGDAAMPPLRLRFAGRLDRPPHVEITETDPPSPTGAATVLRVEGPRLAVLAPELPAAFVLDAGSGRWTAAGNGAVLDVPPPASGQGPIATVRCTSDLAVPASGAPDTPSTTLEAPSDRPLRRIVDRALAYVRGCTALATAADERAILADHRVLPLSWTRDAYFQALLLLAAGGPGDRRRVADHLRWLWRRCERPDDRWVRSHHANGRRKDLAFQADQQLYPLLELADYWRRTGTLPDGVEWSADVEAGWSAALGEIDPNTGLIACAENAADDPAPAPYIAGSQILLWYASRRLAEMASSGALSLDVAALDAVAGRVRAGFDRELIDGDRWAYATDGAGRRVAYHDANDLPTALAPLWGFCASDDRAWRATMRWAFSAANPGYAAEQGGLGSFHSPGAWTLGDIQRWLVGRTVGDEVGARRALERLQAVAFDDGMLPEAYGAEREPAGRIRHWFAWPGAALGAYLLLDARGELEATLRA